MAMLPIAMDIESTPSKISPLTWSAGVGWSWVLKRRALSAYAERCKKRYRPPQISRYQLTAIAARAGQRM